MLLPQAGPVGEDINMGFKDNGDSREMPAAAEAVARRQTLPPTPRRERTTLPTLIEVKAIPDSGE